MGKAHHPLAGFGLEDMHTPPEKKLKRKFGGAAAAEHRSKATLAARRIRESREARLAGNAALLAEKQASR